MSKENIKIPFALIGIQTLEFAIIKELYSDNDPDIQIGINAEFGIKSAEDHEIVCVPEVSFLQDGKPFLKIKVGCYFSVKPEQWKKYIQEESQSIIFPKGFTDHLLMIATGTLRGVLHAKTEGTIFNQFVLPTINITTLSEGNIEMKL
ncbi:hypothetical protein [Bacteroides sp. 519]|uniref:hypothetical protein n=1 Tax=Bacteroides sp. 519 TaxID=2302937 RepID=UPI0013D1FE6D|nr:hypothetical protein [Bacteroides sp. 519]NDV57341.1 hypothetical protein [Bacteroides sp. 519]